MSKRIKAQLLFWDIEKLLQNQKHCSMKLIVKKWFSKKKVKPIYVTQPCIPPLTKQAF